MTTTPPTNSPNVNLGLQLGDIIHIKDPTNKQLNNNVFFIDYLDSTFLKLINTSNLKIVELKINEDGTIENNTISEIELLSRKDSPSYAIQNNLLPNTWVNIYFSGKLPKIITGEITNLEEDMVEIKIYPSNEIIYLNFDYKGIPLLIPIEYIEIRDKVEPEQPTGPEPEPILQPQSTDFDIDNLEGIDYDYQNVEPTNDNKVKNRLKEIILNANEIHFEDDILEPIYQYVAVDKLKQRYDIDAQTQDLLDNLLARIPTNNRTPSTLNNIHKMIERFKQLRNTFSDFDEYGNITSKRTHTAYWKPMLSYFEKFDTPLYWIIPVVKNIKKIYNSPDPDRQEEYIQPIDMIEDLNVINNIMKQYQVESTNEENKYDLLFTELNSPFTPFEYNNSENVNDIINNLYVGTDLNVVVDNAGNLYSSVYSDGRIVKKRCLFERYTTGLDKLTATNFKGSDLIATRNPLTPNDLLEIKSFITLPEPTIHFSRINLPGTTILEKANLNNTFLNYWKLLKKQTNVQQILLNDIDTDINYDEDNFVNNIKNFVLNLPNNEKNSKLKKEKYDKFVSSIIPKTRILFNLVKKYIKGKLSIVDVVNYLEPFRIYTDDITYMQYKAITQFLNEKISEYNREYINKSKMFMIFKRRKNTPNFTRQAFPILRILSEYKNTKEPILENYYDISNQRAKEITNSELLAQLLLQDNTSLYVAYLSLENIHLMFPTEMNQLFEEQQKQLKNTIKTKQNNEKCKTYTIAKNYLSQEDLLNDNNEPDIYFDQKYDDTNYGILDKYETQLKTMEPTAFLNFLIDDLSKKLKLTQEHATYLAETLRNGYKTVKNGHHAILHDITIEPAITYYVRKNNSWVLDDTIEVDAITDNNNLLCNLQTNCISKYSTPETCESMEISKKELQKTLIGSVMSEFDEKYNVTLTQYQKQIKEKFNYFLSIEVQLRKLHVNSLMKYTNKHYLIGLQEIGTDTDTKMYPLSPYAKLRDLIFGMSDFIKRQHYTVKFTNLFTRKHYVNQTGLNNEPESEYWLYCNKTDVKLMPAFRYTLAVEYLNSPDKYNDYVDLIVKQIGFVSGDSWYDKHTLYMIKKIDYDEEEGYENGFKMKTHDIMEEDLGQNILGEVKKQKIFNTPETLKIYNIVQTISIEIGINVDAQLEFIINNVLEHLKESLPNEELYKKHVRESAKPLPSFAEVYNQGLLFSSVGVLLIAIQTSMPQIKTRKTVPGCIKSFSGYPLEGAGDYSSVVYLACTLTKLKTPYEPWNSLQRKSATTIADKLQKMIEQLITLPNIVLKMKEKVEYLLYNPEATVLPEYEIINWVHFLPPLVPFKIKRVENITPQFNTGLITDLKHGNPQQHEKIMVIKSKIIRFSLEIQTKIQNVINKKKLLLHSMSNQQYIENSCCNELDRRTTIQYFQDKEPDIITLNTQVQQLAHLLTDIQTIYSPSLFTTKINTKNTYPPITLEFNEDTIYSAFILFCKFKSMMPIPRDFLPLCPDKPVFVNEKDSIQEIIKKLKNDGKTYTNEGFLRLLQLANRENIIHLEYFNKTYSPVEQLANYIQLPPLTTPRQIGQLEAKFKGYIQQMMKTPTNEGIKNINNYLHTHISTMKTELVKHINTYGNVSKNEMKHIKDFIATTAFVWKSENNVRNQEFKIQDDSLYTGLNFFKNSIQNLLRTFPNIILKGVNYSELLLPKYWKLSSTHNNDIIGVVSKHYANLKKFYDNTELHSVLTTIQNASVDILNMTKMFPCYSNTYNQNNEPDLFNERTNKLMFEYLFLYALMMYVQLSNENDMIVRQSDTTINEPNDTTTMEEADDINTHTEFITPINKEDSNVIQGYKRSLKKKVGELLVAYITNITNHKDSIDTSYDEIMDKIFKLKEKEKDKITDRLKGITKEESTLDITLKRLKLGVWGKGLEKGLTMYDADTYDEEREFGEKMAAYEKKMGKKVADLDNIEEYNEDEEDEGNVEDDDMADYTEDYLDGNYGSDEVDNYSDYY
jgi:hypothetical protein